MKPALRLEYFALPSLGIPFALYVLDRVTLAASKRDLASAEALLVSL